MKFTGVQRLLGSVEMLGSPPLIIFHTLYEYQVEVGIELDLEGYVCCRCMFVMP